MVEHLNFSHQYGNGTFKVTILNEPTKGDSVDTKQIKFKDCTLGISEFFALDNKESSVEEDWEGVVKVENQGKCSISEGKKRR